MKLTRHLLITILLLLGCLTSCKPTQTTAEKASGAKSSAAETTVSTKVPLTEPIATTNPEENGWKNLRWGMSYDEIKDNYDVVDNQYGVTKCIALPRLTPGALFYDEEETIRFGKEVEELGCSQNENDYGYLTGILMYKGRFFGKQIGVPTPDGKMQDDLKTQSSKLKEKYPHGKIVLDQLGNHFFRYVSDDITVFNKTSDYGYSVELGYAYESNRPGIYIYNTKMLHEALKEPLAIKNEEKRLKKERKEESKKPF